MYKINETQLENGLKLYHTKVPSDDISVIANVNTGGLYETDDNSGISHLIEHCLFKGTKKRKSRDIIYNEINSFGGEEYCYTHHHQLPLGMRVILDDFENALDLISDVLFYARMDEKEVEKEKEIVLDEIRNRKDDPNIHIYDKFQGILYDGTILAREICGSEETLRSLTIEQIKTFYKNVFNPNNTKLFIVGNKNFNEVEDQVRKYFGNVQKGPALYLPNIKFPKNSPKISEVDIGSQNVYYLIGKIVPTFGHKDASPLSILSRVLGRKVSDKILNEEPISYNRYANYNQLGSITAELIVSAAGDFSKYQRLRELIKGEFLKCSKGDIPKDYIKEIINSKKKSFILKNTTTLNKAEILLDAWLKGNIDAVNTYLSKLEKITVKQVKEVGIKYASIDDLTEVALGNFQS